MDMFEKMKLYELYYFVLVDNIHEDDIMPYDINYIWNEINNRYYLEFNKKLDINNENDINILFSWLSNKSRYDLLNELMLNTYNRFINKEKIGNIFIDNTDLFFINNISYFKKIINDFKINLNNYDYSDKDVNITQISKGEINYYVKQILLTIDSSGKWASIYDNLLYEDKIIYLDELDEIHRKDLFSLFGINSIKDIDNSCVFLSNGDMYILLTYTNTLKDIPATIHELTHYISGLYGNKNEVPILREFPSIFYELYALDYLSNIGFSKVELSKIYYERVKNTNDLLESILYMMNYLEMLIKKGSITEEIIDINDNIDLNYTINSHRVCDMCSYDLVSNPYIFFRNYPYIIGHYLALVGINNLKENKEIISIVKDINEKLSSINPYDVFIKLNVSDCNLIDVSNKKCKKKINKP